MADKKVTIGLSIEVAAALKKMEQEFAASVKKIQQDFNNLKAPVSKIITPQQDAFQKAGGGGAGVEAFRAHTQATNQATQRGMQEAAINRAKIDILAKEKTFRDDILKIEQKITAEKQAQVKANQQPRGGSAADNRGMLGGPIMHGPWPKPQQPQNPQQQSSSINFGVAAKYGAGALRLLGAAADYMGQRPIEIARMQASAISQTTGRQLSEARSGEYTFEGMYGEDRNKAKDQASSSNKWQTMGDFLKLGASAVALGGAIAGTGGLAGIPALAVGGAGAAGLASGLFGKGMADPSKYAAYQAQREATDFTTLLASQHDLSPFRKDAIERLKSTGTRDLGMERTLGLKDSGYYGNKGYLQGQMNGEFTDEMVTKSSQGILGAGGSTAMGQQSGISLQAQRGLGLTNADQLLGQLSGTQSIPETSKKSLIEIFARGFDSSKYAEENRKYMQAVTESVYKGGTTSVDSVGAIAEMLRASVGNAAPTTRNIEAGKSAFEAFKGATSSTSGYMGGINVSSAMQDKDLAGIKDPAEFQGLISMPYDSISETDEAIVDSASRMKDVTPKQLAEKLRKLKKSNAATGLNRDKKAPVAARRAMAARTGNIGAGDIQGQQAYLNMIDSEGMPEDLKADAIKVAGSQMVNPKTGNAGDTMTQASAKNAQISLETLAASIDKFASDAIAAAKKLGGEAASGRANEVSARAAESASDAASAIAEHLAQKITRSTHTSRLGNGPQPQGN